MSYLDTPRFHFAGQFFTDPSTINNATENYDLNEVYNNQPPSSTNPNSVWWNKDGQAFFKIPQATVTSALDQNGAPAPNDSIINAQIVSVITGGPPTPQYGRLVDLDPDQQSRSMIVGLRIQLTIPSETGVSLAGTVRPMTIIDLWGRMQGGSAGGIFSAGCMYQSVLDDIEWAGMDSTGSNILKQLYSMSTNTLSIKLVLDGYNGTITSDQFALGRMVGTIGPYIEGEPAHFLAQRRLFINAESVVNSPMNNAPFQVKGSKLIIDLGNSVPTGPKPDGTAGPFQELGNVNVVLDPLFENLTLGTLFTSAADYTTQYQNSAGIFELDLGQNADAVKNKPLAILINAPSGTISSITGLAATRLKEGLTLDQTGATPQPTPTPASIALAEFQDGYYVDVDFNGLRMQKGAAAWSDAANTGTEITSSVEIPLVARQWGQPVPNLVIAISPTLNWYQFVDSDGYVYQINNSPMSAISWTSPVITDANGRAVLTFTAEGLDASQRDPRRADIDGQLYLFDFSYSHYSLGAQVQPITLLVFEDTPVVQNPTWWKDIHPIFLQYARLYPAMRSLIDLSDYATVTASDAPLYFSEKIKAVLNLPMAHPGYMPVTRDLSMVRRQMIMNWFDNGAPEGTPPAAKKPGKSPKQGTKQAKQTK